MDQIPALRHIHRCHRLSVQHADRAGVMLLWFWSGITALIGLASVTVLLCGLSRLSRLRNRPGKRANESDYRKV